MRILIAEDEERIASFVEKGLKAAGYLPRTVADGIQAHREAAEGAYDLMLLDIGLPGLDGFEVLRRLRAGDSQLPVIMLTARAASADIVAALDQGASDYLVKPFTFDELLARIRLRLRDASQREETVLQRGELSLDLRTRRASAAGTSVELSAREFALAEELLRHADQVLSREQLLSRVWGFDFDPGSNVVDVYIGYLRAKFGAGVIETVRGVGYRLR